jgi:hypothetical protein
MDPTGSERRGTPTLGAVLVMVLIGVGALSYDNFATPPTTIASVDTQSMAAATALAKASCTPGTQPADLQCTSAYDYTCPVGTPAAQCPQKKPGGLGLKCSEPAGATGKTIEGTCQCLKACKTTPDGGTGGSPPGLPSIPSGSPPSGGSQPPTTPTTCGQPGADPSTCTSPIPPNTCGQAGADPSTCTPPLTPIPSSPAGSDVFGQNATPVSNTSIGGVSTIPPSPNDAISNVAGQTGSTPAANPTETILNPSTAASPYVLDDYGNPLKDVNGNPIKTGDTAALQAAAQQESAQGAINFPANNTFGGTPTAEPTPEPKATSVSDTNATPISFVQSPFAAPYTLGQIPNSFATAPIPGFGDNAQPVPYANVVVPGINGDWVVANAGTQDGIVPGTDQPGVAANCANGGCIDAQGNPIPATNGVYPGTDQPGVDCSKGGCVDAQGNPIPATNTKAPASEILAAKETDPTDARLQTAPTQKDTKTTTDNTKTPPSSDDSTKNNNSGGGSALSSLLGALGKALAGALGGSPAAAPAQACSTDPNAYAQQQQQYQTALQNYNYQQQQYQYQLQLNAAYGNNNIAPIAPTQPTPCTPSTAQQCSVQPPQPTAGTCTGGNWTPQMSGSCVVGWQCSNLGAQLSCAPATADVGSTLSISYSCAQGTASGDAFSASGTSGTSTAVIQTPPAGTNTATYNLTCTNGAVTSGAQCSVQIVQPNIVLVANPATVASGGTSLIGWVTTGMQACVISSPTDHTFTTQNSANTSVNGSVQTTALTYSSNEYDLTCLTLTGQTKSSAVIVKVPGGATPPSPSAITATSTADGGVLNHGDSVTITWQSTNEPAGAAVALWIYDPHSNTDSAIITSGQALSGTYTWSVPAAASACPSDGSFNICGTDLVAGRQYQIEADVYTPGNAYVGDGAPPSSPVVPTYGDFGDGAPFTIGQ